MNKETLVEEVIRIIFGCNFNQFNYTWERYDNTLCRLVATQRVLPCITDPTSIYGFPLRRNTLQVLNALKVALPIFDIPLEKTEITVQINGIEYDLFKQYQDITQLLDEENTKTQSIRAIPITLKVPQVIYKDKIEPYHPSKEKNRAKNPQKTRINETLEEIQYRLKHGKDKDGKNFYFNSKTAAANFVKTLVSDTFTTSWFTTNWKNTSANKEMSAFLQSNGQTTKDTKYIQHTLNFSQNYHEQILLIKLLREILVQEIPEPLFNYICDGFFLNNGNNYIKIFTADENNLHHMVASATQKNPTKILLILAKNIYEENIASHQLVDADGQFLQSIENLITQYNAPAPLELKRGNAIFQWQQHYWINPDEEDNFTKIYNNALYHYKWYVDQDAIDKKAKEAADKKRQQQERQEKIRNEWKNRHPAKETAVINTTNSVANHADLLEKVTSYIDNRKANEKDYFGIFDRFFGGCSKAQKLSAAEALKEALAGNLTQQALEEKHGRALNQRTLGDLYNNHIKPCLFTAKQPLLRQEQKQENTL